MYRYRVILEALVREVEADLPHQVVDATHPAYGAFVASHYGMPAADHTSGGLSVARAVCALLAEQSPLHLDPDLCDRVLAGLRFIQRAQRPTGLIDLPKVDFDSPPDTAFLVQMLCPLLVFARRVAADGNATAQRVAEALAETIAPMAAGIVGRGFRTPNHRWVVCSALAQAKQALPGFDADAYVNSILAETIDINPDGEFSERSTGIYNAVCNRSLRYVADSLPRLGLLEHVRSNLDFMSMLIDVDGTVVTAISRRQDQGSIAHPLSMADSFFDLGIRDGNAEWIDIADRLVRRELQQRITPAASTADHSLFWMLQPFLMRADGVERPPSTASRPTRPVRKLLRHSQIWSSSHEQYRALALGGNATAFTLQCGDAVLQSLRVCGTYFHAAHFMADSLEQSAGVDASVPTGVVLRHVGRCRADVAWDLPLNRPVTFDNPHRGYYALADDGVRDRWHLPPLDITLHISEVAGGYDLLLETAGGYDGIPFAIEMIFPVGGTLELADVAFAANGASDVVLKSGYATYRRGRHAIKIGPGADAHRVADCRHNAGPVAGCFKLLIPVLTPVRHPLQIRCGVWSEALRDVLLPQTVGATRVNSTLAHLKHASARLRLDSDWSKRNNDESHDSVSPTV